MATGSIFGLPLMFILKKTGKDHSVAKGLVTSILSWGVLYTGGQKIGLYKKNRLTKSHYSAMFNNVIYGVTAAKTMITIADPAIFENRKQKNSNTFNSKGEYNYLIGTNMNTDQETPTYLH